MENTQNTNLAHQAITAVLRHCMRLLPVIGVLLLCSSAPALAQTCYSDSWDTDSTVDGIGVTENDYSSTGTYEVEVKLTAPSGAISSDYAPADYDYVSAHTSYLIDVENPEVGEYSIDTYHYKYFEREIPPQPQGHSEVTPAGWFKRLIKFLQIKVSVGNWKQTLNATGSCYNGMTTYTKVCDASNCGPTSLCQGNVGAYLICKGWYYRITSPYFSFGSCHTSCHGSGNYDGCS